MSRFGVQKRAAREHWPCTEVTGKGGKRKEYQVSSLPADIQQAIAKKEAAQTAENLPVLRTATLPAVLEQSPESLKGWQREIYLARKMVLHELDLLEAELGGPSKAMKELVRRVKEGELPQRIQTAIAAANARKGAAAGR